MRLRFCQFCCLILGLAGRAALAQNQFILRPATQGTVTTLAQKYGLTVVQPVDDNQKAFVVTGPATAAPKDLEKEVGDDQDVSNFELDQNTGLPEVTQSTAAILDSLPTATSITYYGASVLAFYTAQPAVTLTRIPDAQALGINGTGIVVAIIDTGVDPTHPVLQSQLLPGYDFVHNLPGTASEWIDLTAENQAALAQSSPLPATKNTVAMVSQSTAAILDQSTAAILDYNNLPHAFGHGTMVAGIVHLVAPSAQILPLKAFSGDGTANLSNILRAVYFAADNGARVINMSFTLTAPSAELAKAIQYAASKGVICVAAAGNTGLPGLGNPANLSHVPGVASTSNLDVRSVFSSYGKGVFLAAPGEGVVTTYPGMNYAEATGTSFSSPLVAGAGALLLQYAPHLGDDRLEAMGSAKHLTSTGLGHGRLDAYRVMGAAKD
jgi:subtilisin family serine protease